MKKRNCLVCVISLALLASAPLNATAEVLDDSFYGEIQADESVDMADLEEADDFISEDVENTNLFSSQIEESSTEENVTANDGWVVLENEPKISFKYDSESKVLSFKASEPAELPNNIQSGRTSEWYVKNAEVSNATTVVIGDNITKIGERNFSVSGYRTCTLLFFPGCQGVGEKSGSIYKSRPHPR